MKSLCKRFTLALGVIITASVILHGAISVASSCCAGGGGQSVCVLTSDQKYQLGMADSYRDIEGHYDPYGVYKANGSETKASVETLTVGAAYRLNEDWQLALSIPIVRNDKTYSGSQNFSTGVGDPDIEGRYLMWEDLNFLTYRPQVVFYGGTRMPIGTSIYNSKEASEVDVTGEGIFTPYIGVNAAKLFRPVLYTIDGSYYYPLSKNVTEVHSSPTTPYNLKPGNRIQLIEAVTYLISGKWSSGVGFKQLWQFESTVDSAATAGSASRIFSTTLSANYFHDSSLSFSVSYETSNLFKQYLINQPQAQSVSVTMTYGAL